MWATATPPPWRRTSPSSHPCLWCPPPHSAPPSPLPPAPSTPAPSTPLRALERTTPPRRHHLCSPFRQPPPLPSDRATQLVTGICAELNVEGGLTYLGKDTAIMKAFELVASRLEVEIDTEEFPYGLLAHILSVAQHKLRIVDVAKVCRRHARTARHAHAAPQHAQHARHAHAAPQHARHARTGALASWHARTPPSAHSCSGTRTFPPRVRHTAGRQVAQGGDVRAGRVPAGHRRGAPVEEPHSRLGLAPSPSPANPGQGLRTTCRPRLRTSGCPASCRPRLRPRPSQPPPLPAFGRPRPPLARGPRAKSF